MTQPEAEEPQALIERMHRALNAHDVEAFVACFATDYRSEQPAHPDRQFGGREQVRENWAGTFQEVPNFRAELLRSVVAGEAVWAEWRWQGTRRDGTLLDMGGVTIMGVRNGQIAWARLYMEFVEEGGDGITEAVRRMREGTPPTTQLGAS